VVMLARGRSIALRMPRGAPKIAEPATSTHAHCATAEVAVAGFDPAADVNFALRANSVQQVTNAGNTLVTVYPTAGAGPLDGVHRAPGRCRCMDGPRRPPSGSCMRRNATDVRRP